MIWRIRSRAVFAELASSGRRVRSDGVLMTFSPQPDPQPMLAFAFGRKFGSAVERNRARRRLRAAFVEAWDPANGPSGAFLITGRRSVLDAEFDRLVAALHRCFAQLNTKVAVR